MTPRVDLTRSLSLAGDVNAMSYESDGASDDFGSSTTSYGLRTSYMKPGLQARGDVAWSRMLRDATVEGASFRTATNRVTLQGQLDATSRRGR